MLTKLIVALDFNDMNKAELLLDKLDRSCAIKVGSELFTRAGPQWVKQLVDRRFKVFLDLKFHDIPNTVEKACKAAADLGVWMLNVHALGGAQMMQQARTALESYGADKPLLIAVTILTSFCDHDLKSLGMHHSLIAQVKYLAKMAKDAGLDGVVSSAHEVQEIKQGCGQDFITVTPGIRLQNGIQEDQQRVMTPQYAIEEGSDFLVIGRPITQSLEPEKVIATILKDIK